jgi:hypothetical protein
MATILPNPYEECVNSSRPDEIPLIEAFRVMAGFRFTCGDVLYSGHAANFTLMAMIWQEYGRTFTDNPGGLGQQQTKRGSLPLNYLPDNSILTPDEDVEAQTRYSKQWFVSKFFPGLFWAIASTGYLIIIACRFHYTVDVVVGIVVVAKQWGLYHMVIRTPKLLEQVPVLQWYESKGIYHPSNKPDQIYDIEEIGGDNESEFGFEETPRHSGFEHSHGPVSEPDLTPPRRIVSGDPVELAQVGRFASGKSPME